MKALTLLATAAACLGLALPNTLWSQSVQYSLAPSDGAGGAPAVRNFPSKPVAVDPKPLTGRWLDLKTLSHAERYRSAYNQGGYHLFEDGQQRCLVEARIKLDSEARYTIGVRASSGRYFNWAFADFAGQGISARGKNPLFFASFTPAQAQEIFLAAASDPVENKILSSAQSNGWNFYVRELYFSATPIKALTFEFGSFGVERGGASEITTFDEDGYLVGERVRIQDPKHLFFDQVGFTGAYLGDLITPSVFVRGGGFKQDNYRQFFVKRQFGERLGISADYTWQVGTDTLRQSATVGTREFRIVDKLRLETYERVNTILLQGLEIKGRSGFAVTAEKKITPRLNVDLGFASIDKDYTVYGGSRLMHAIGYSLNGDSYGTGKRPFAHASYKLNSVITASSFYTHAVGASVLNFDQQNFNAGLNFDFKALINTEKKIF